MKMFEVLDSVLIYVNQEELSDIRYRGFCGQCRRLSCCPIDYNKRIIIINEEDKKDEREDIPAEA